MSLQRAVNDVLRFARQKAQVVRAAKALDVDLVDILRARWARGKPSACGNHLDTADRRVIAGRTIEHLVDRLAGQLGNLHLFRRELRELLFLLGSRRRLDSVGNRRAEVAGQIAIELGWIAAAARG